MNPDCSSGQEDISGLIERAQQATERRDWLEALRCWEAVRTNSPDHAPAYLEAATALREVGRYDEAELVFGAAAERFPDNEQIAVNRAWLANARRDWPTAVSRWEAVRARFPESPWCFLGNANALRGAGRSDEVAPLLATAEAVLTAAKQRGLDAGAALRAEFEIAQALPDWAAVRQSAEKIVASEASPSAHMLLLLAQACRHLGDLDAADRSALRALSYDPKFADAVLLRASIATDRGDGESALACYRALVEINPAAVRWRLKVVQLLNWFGRVKEAVSELEKVRLRWPNDPTVRAFLRVYGPASAMTPGSASAASPTAESDRDRAEEQEIQAIADRAPGPAEWARPILVADPERDVLLAELTGAETAVLVFTTANDGFSMPLPIFDRYLATLNLTAVYLKDFKRLRFLQGIRSLSDDYQGTLDALRNMLSRLGAKRLCTIGNCDGGFGAIRYGVELGADRILAFSAPTYSPDEDPLTKLEQARNFTRNRLAANVARDMMDLKPFLEARAYGAQIELFYRERNTRDRLHALHLSGLPGIRLHPQAELTSRPYNPMGLYNPDLLASDGMQGLVRGLALAKEDFRGVLANLLGVE